MIKKLFFKHGNEIGKEYWDKILKEYMQIRTIESYNYEKSKNEAKIVHFSINSIENQIRMLENGLENNKLPDGLHPVDLYFKHNSQVEIETLLRTNIKLFNDVLGRIKTRAYKYLIKCEKDISNMEIENIKKIENNKEIFIIHGHNEAKWRELKEMIQSEFNLNPIILQEQPDKGMTIIEKFEHYAEKCCYSFAIFTPDDIIENNGIKYFQARPNVIFELGWFCSFLGRKRVCIIFQNGSNMDIFSDFQGVIQKRFHDNINEIYRDINSELKEIGII